MARSLANILRAICRSTISANTIEIPNKRTQSLDSWSYWIRNDAVTSAATLEPTALTMFPISSPTRSFARALYSRFKPAATANTGSAITSRPSCL